MNKNLKNEGYKNLLGELKSIISNGQHQVYKAVDNIKVQMYWQIGERIVREELNNKDRADYGKYLTNNLSVDLNIKKRLMYRIIRFYKLYSIVASLMPQLSWTHYYLLVDIKDQTKRNFYEQKTIANSWSVRELNK